MEKILVVDNYDSFVYNLVQLLRESGRAFDIVRNDCIPFDRLSDYRRLLLSPGPGVPQEAGELLRLIGQCHATHSILGVCLGHQAIGEYFGAEVRQLSLPKHGHASPLRILEPDDTLYRGVEDGTIVGRYHSWVLDRDTFPSCLHPTAVDEDGNIMSFTHRTLPVFGVQYHPESVITVQGQTIVRNWLSV